MRASKGPDSTPVTGTPRTAGPDIRLCVAQVETIKQLAGWTNAELARQMGMDQSAVMRLLKPPGDKDRLELGRKSIAGLLAAVRRRFGGHVCLCGLFEVIDADGEIIALRDPEQVHRQPSTS